MKRLVKVVIYLCGEWERILGKAKESSRMVKVVSRLSWGDQKIHRLRVM